MSLPHWLLRAGLVAIIESMYRHGYAPIAGRGRHHSMMVDFIRKLFDLGIGLVPLLALQGFGLFLFGQAVM
jgi:hypothetical protein